MIGSGEYGKLLGIKAVAIWSRDMNYYQASPWRASMAQAGGGCMINQAIHTLDQMQLLGGPIKILQVRFPICFTMRSKLKIQQLPILNLKMVLRVHFSEPLLM